MNLYIVLAATVSLLPGQATSQAAPASPTTAPATSAPAAEPFWKLPADAPWWQRDGLVIMAVDDVPADRAWRTTQGRTRRPTFNELEDYSRERSEELLTHLKSLGASLVLVPYGGFGPDKTEGDERQVARDTISRCHRLGLRAGVWLPINQADPALWSEAGEDVSTWLALDKRGQPVASSFPGRKHLSFAVEAVLNRAKDMAREAAAAGADAIALPEWRVAMGCEPPAVAAAAGMAGDDSLRAAFSGGLPGDDQAPHVAAWMAARADMLRRAADDILAAARAVNPQILLVIDAGSVSGQLGAFEGPVIDPPTLFRSVDLVLSPLQPRLGERGVVLNQIVDLKGVVAAGGRSGLLQMTRLSLAQQLAFGGDAVGCLGWFRNGHLSHDALGRMLLQPDVVSMAESYRRSRALFVDMRPQADVLVYRPRSARLRLSDGAEAEYVQAVNALVSHRVSFDFHFDEALPKPQDDQALLVAGLARVTASQAESLRRFVADGGRVLIVGDLRVEKDGAAETRWSQGAAGADAPSSRPDSASAVTSIGRGRVVELARPGPPANVWLTAERSSRARTAPAIESDEFVTALRALLGRPLTIEGKLERGVAVALTASADAGRRALHLVRFGPGQAGPAELQLRLPEPARIRQVLRYDFDAGTVEPVVFQRLTRTIGLSVPAMATYQAFLIE